MVTTTLNVRADILSIVSGIALRLELSRRDVIVLLLMKIMRDHRRFRRGFGTVQYQPDNIMENWRCVHIRLREDENEYFVDLRKICKRSVSLLLAIAVDKYITELLTDEGFKINDHVRFCNYVLYGEIVDGDIISWRLYWGFPVDELKTLRL